MTTAIDVSQVPGTWLHSREEDGTETTVFRPASYPFPPARGRRGFQLAADGTATAIGPGPGDRTAAAPRGTWTFAVAGGRGQLTIRIPGRADETFDVDSIDAERLVVRT